MRVTSSFWLLAKYSRLRWLLLDVSKNFFQEWLLAEAAREALNKSHLVLSMSKQNLENNYDTHNFSMLDNIFDLCNLFV